MAPPGLPFAFGRGHDDFAWIGAGCFNRLSAQATMTAEHNIDQGVYPFREMVRDRVERLQAVVI